MSAETTFHVDHDPRLNRSALLRRRGNGPWAREKSELWALSYYPGYKIDQSVNDVIWDRQLPVSKPNPFSSSVAERLFHHVPGVQYSSYGQITYL